MKCGDSSFFTETGVALEDSAGKCTKSGLINHAGGECEEDGNCWNKSCGYKNRDAEKKGCCEHDQDRDKNTSTFLHDHLFKAGKSYCTGQPKGSDCHFDDMCKEGLTCAGVFPSILGGVCSDSTVQADPNNPNDALFHFEQRDAYTENTDEFWTLYSDEEEINDIQRKQDMIENFKYYRKQLQTYFKEERFITILQIVNKPEYFTKDFSKIGVGNTVKHYKKSLLNVLTFIENEQMEHNNGRIIG